MVRTQIQLTERQSAAVRQVAVERNVSMAEVIRQGIDQFLGSVVAVDREERVRRAIDAAGQFHSGAEDVSDRHDQYLMEAYRA